MSLVDAVCMAAAASCFGVLLAEGIRSVARARRFLRDLDSEHVDV